MRSTPPRIRPAARALLALAAATASGCIGSPPALPGTTDGTGSSSDGTDTTEGTVLDFELDGPCLLAPAQQLADFVDTAQLSCAHDPTPGNGRIPAGVTLEGCVIGGEPAEIFDPPDGPMPQPSVRHIGVWAFVVRVEDQSGSERHVPVCVPYLGSAPVNHSIELVRGGTVVSLAEPSEALFEVGSSVAFGSVTDPVFRISRTDGPENLEFDMEIVSSTDSPIGAPSLSTLAQQNVLTELEFWLELGPTTIADQTPQQPFVTSIDLVFCAEYATSAACDPAHDLEFGSVAVTHSIVFWPAG